MTDAPLLAVSHSDKLLHDILVLNEDIKSRRPDRVGQAQPTVKKAIETTLNCYMHGGCTGDAIKGLERMEATLRNLAK